MNDKILKGLGELDEYTILSIWNEYKEDTHCYDDTIYSMEEFNDLMNGYDPDQIASRVCYGNFNPWHDWFMFNGYGNLVSSDYPVDEWVYMDDLGEWIEEEWDNLPDWIRDIIPDMEEEDE